MIGFHSALSGATLRETKRKVVTEDMIYLNMNQRFSRVFGPCGLLHFFFPFLPFEAPPVDEGYRRIITYNSDYVVDGMVITNHREEETMALLENTDY